MKISAKAALAIVLSLGFDAPLFGGQLEDADSAYERRDYATAIRLWRPLAEKGNANAQYKLGSLYVRGEGVPQDYSEAIRWFRLSAEQGHSKAQHDLGVMYYLTDGVPHDYAEAAIWFRKSADQGNVRAQENLGRMYSFGHGVRKNNGEALRWMRSAAEQGDPESEFALGGFYFATGDNAEAMKWYLKSADQGFVNAQTFAAMILEGSDIELRKVLCEPVDESEFDQEFCSSSNKVKVQARDYVQAYKWYYLAETALSRKGYSGTLTEAIDGLTAKMTPAQIAEAQKLVRQWKPK